MLEDFVLNEHKKINEKSEKEKKGVSYIAGLIEQEPEKFERIFNPEGKIPKSDFPEKVYNSVKKTIQRLDEEHTRSFGVTISYFIPGMEPRNPAVLLGWAKYKCNAPVTAKNSNHVTAHILQPTELGISVMNNYRESLGGISTEKHMEKNKEFIKKLTNSCA